MTKYIKQEIADLNETGTPQARYRVLTYGRRTFKEFAEQCAKGSTISVSDILAVVSRISGELAWQISQGYTVTIDGLGTFSGQLGVINDRPMDDFSTDSENRNSRSLGFKGINFRADKRLVAETNMHCTTLERAGESRLCRSPYTEEQRVERARKWLGEHTIMHVGDYAALNGLSYSTASLELRRVARDPSSGITARGRRSAKVYLLAE